MLSVGPQWCRRSDAECGPEGNNHAPSEFLRNHVISTLRPTRLQPPLRCLSQGHSDCIGLAEPQKSAEEVIPLWRQPADILPKDQQRRMTGSKRKQHRDIQSVGVNSNDQRIAIAREAPECATSEIPLRTLGGRLRPIVGWHGTPTTELRQSKGDGHPKNGEEHGECPGERQ